MLALVLDSTGRSLRSVLAAEVGESTIGRVAERLLDVVAGLDPTGRPLFAGVQALDRPEDPYAALWQACLGLREHRGDGHVGVYGAAGWDPVRMNVLTELWLGYGLGEYSGTRAWSEQRAAEALAVLRAAGPVDGDGITDAGRAVRGELEGRTDEREQPVLDALGDDLDGLVTLLRAWGDRCVAAAVFPSDPRKRAAG